MWAKNSEEFLCPVLKRIDHVIPFENINRRIFVDDSSTDRTILIAKDFNWEVYPNRKGFVRGGIIEAFRHTEMPFAVSVEHDVLLDENWWDIMPLHMEKSIVAVANGICLLTLPSIRAIQMYQSGTFGSWIGLSNTIYRTKIIKSITIPKHVTVSVDLELHRILGKLGYKWVVDSSVRSDHIRTSVLGHFAHLRKLYKLSNERQNIDKRNSLRLALETLFSPLFGLNAAIKTKRPQVIPVYMAQNLLDMEMHLIRKQSKKTYFSVIDCTHGTGS